MGVWRHPEQGWLIARATRYEQAASNPDQRAAAQNAPVRRKPLAVNDALREVLVAASYLLGLSPTMNSVTPTPARIPPIAIVPIAKPSKTLSVLARALSVVSSSWVRVSCRL